MTKTIVPDILDIFEVAEMIGVSVSQVRRLIVNAGLPKMQYVKRGRLRFSEAAVAGWLKKKGGVK